MKQLEIGFNNLFYEEKKEDKSVNIFYNEIYRVTISLSMRCKTYCFAMQKRRFYTIKAAVLHCKTAAFATPKRSYHFLRKLYLQNQSSFLNQP